MTCPRSPGLGHRTPAPHISFLSLPTPTPFPVPHPLPLLWEKSLSLPAPGSRWLLWAGSVPSLCPLSWSLWGAQDHEVKGPGCREERAWAAARRRRHIGGGWKRRQTGKLLLFLPDAASSRKPPRAAPPLGSWGPLFWRFLRLSSGPALIA